MYNFSENKSYNDTMFYPCANIYEDIIQNHSESVYVHGAIRSLIVTVMYYMILGSVSLLELIGSTDKLLNARIIMANHLKKPWVSSLCIG